MLSTIKKTIQNSISKATVLIFLLTCKAHAIQRTDLTQDTSGGRTLTNVAENTDNLVGVFITLALSLFGLVGVIVFGLSLLSLHRASKEDGRERPTGAVVGLFIGGALIGLAVLIFIVRNSIIG